MKFFKKYFLLLNIFLLSAVELNALELSTLKTMGSTGLKVTAELLPSLGTIYSTFKSQQIVPEIIAEEAVDSNLEQAVREVLKDFNFSYALTIPVKKMNETGTIRYTYFSKTMIMNSKMIIINEIFVKDLEGNT